MSIGATVSGQAPDSPTRYRLLCFDLDGTLVDTAAEIAEAVQSAFASCGLAPPSLDDVTRRIGGGARSMIDRLVDGRRADVDALLAQYEHRYAGIAGRACRPYPGVPDALARLRAAGVRLACVTNKAAGFSERVLVGCGLGQSFDLLVGGDTLAVRKPDGRVLRHVVDALGGTLATTAHVGDSRTDIEAARNAGVSAWAVPYGYNGGEPVASADPDRLFDDLAGVADFVLSAD